MLKERVILVTGGMGLLGSATVEAIRNAGGVGIVTSRDRAAVVEYNRRHRDDNTRAYLLDFRSRASTGTVVRRVLADFGSIDGLVNNAYANLPYKAVEELPWEHWEEATRVGFAVPTTLAAELVRRRSDSKISSIVNISSMYGVVAPDFTMYPKGHEPSALYYGAVKSGLIAMTRYLAAYWAPLGIRVNAVAPGGVRNHQKQPFLRRYSATVPHRRMVTPREVAETICFLLSDASSGITGQNLVVDAGKTIW